MKILPLVMALLLPLPALAHTTAWRESRNGTVDFWMQSGDESRIYLEHFVVAPGRLQKRIDHRSYDHVSAADAAFRELTGGYSASRPASLAARAAFATEVKDESIWPTRSEWNSDWENKYSAWVRDNLDANFMVKYQIATDCADVAVAIRWIFARINGLPALDHLMGTGELFGNESMRQEWQSLPAGGDWVTDLRFRAALSYVLDNTYTHSIMTDFYPVKIDAEGVAAGTDMLHLYSDTTGHTEVIRWAGQGQPNAIQMVASDVPKKVRVLNDYGIQDWGYPPVKGRDGLFRFLWPVRGGQGWVLQDPTRMPLYSLEQYDPNFSNGYDNFTDALIARVVPHFSFDARAALRAHTDDLWNRLQARVKVVTDGYAHCSQSPCVEGTPDWEAWSTPSRDAAIQRMVGSVEGIYGNSACTYQCQSELDSRRSGVLTQLDRAYTLGDAITAWDQATFSSDPNDTINRRWGW